MRLVRCKFGYNQKFTPTEQVQIKSAMILGDANPQFKEDGEFDDWWTPHLVDLDLLPNKALESLSDIKPINTPKLEELAQREQTVVNQRINVAVPGFGLMAIRQVKVCYDYCTDNLREELDSGWQILAICPQPDQRRPDYVLGKPQEKDE